jgi:pilus assembly protein CpaF
LPWELIPLLQAAVRARLSLLLSGSTGSGKTTLLRLLIGEVPSFERIITIEDQRELHLRTGTGGRLNTISLEARDANTEGRGEVTIQQLVRNALRQRPDRIFVGECRGARRERDHPARQQRPRRPLPDGRVGAPPPRPGDGRPGRDCP